ncbi:MAG: hypothetical protein RTU09_05240 [Candidatus Thorarchaeota archaeon]
MKDIKIDETIMETTSKTNLVDHKKALVTLEPGCAWVYLKENSERIGVAFAGPSHFAVDAITETGQGAVGESIAGSLGGIQVYIGKVKLDNTSRTGSSEALAGVGYNSIESFHQDIDSKIGSINGKDKHERVKIESDGNIFLGMDNQEKKVLLVTKEDDLVFTYDKRVFVVGEDGKHVSITKEGVAVIEPDGRSIVIDRDGIRGLDSLEHLANFGDTISSAIYEGMRGLKGLKGLKAIKDLKGDWAADFDWDDDE